MPPTPDAPTAETRARQLLDNRITTIRALVKTRQALDDLNTRLAAAHTEDIKAYRAARADGWSTDELRKLGLDEPPKLGRARRAKKAPTAPPPAAEPARPDPADQPARD